MNQLTTRGIVLSRTDFGEADRIITLLTPDHGKLRLMGRGVRKVKSKLAGGIELFSVSDITYIPGRGDIGTLVSARLDTHFGRIVQDLQRVQLGYELIKQINKATEDSPEPEYFELIQQAFTALNDASVSVELIQVWFPAQLLRLSGHTPNLTSDTNGDKLTPEQGYNFDFEAMTFTPHPHGGMHAPLIKVLRLLFDGHEPIKLQHVQGISEQLANITPLIRTMQTTYIRV